MTDVRSKKKSEHRKQAMALLRHDFTFWRMLNPVVQRAHHTAIVAAFDGLMALHPDRKEFTECLEGITLFPEMLWAFWRTP